MIEKKKEFFLGPGAHDRLRGPVHLLLAFLRREERAGLLDNLYNSISKGSAYYIPKMKDEARP